MLLVTSFALLNTTPQSIIYTVKHFIFACFLFRDFAIVVLFAEI